MFTYISLSDSQKSEALKAFLKGLALGTFLFYFLLLSYHVGYSYKCNLNFDNTSRFDQELCKKTSILNPSNW